MPLNVIPFTKNAEGEWQGTVTDNGETATYSASGCPATVYAVSYTKLVPATSSHFNFLSSETGGLASFEEMADVAITKTVGSTTVVKYTASTNPFTNGYAPQAPTGWGTGG